MLIYYDHNNYGNLQAKLNVHIQWWLILPTVFFVLKYYFTLFSLVLIEVKQA